MSFSLTVFEKQIAFHFQPILFASLAQQVVSFFWYGIAFASVYCYYYAVDKGVKRAEYAIRRYGVTFKIISSLFSDVLRSIVIAGLIAFAEQQSASLGVYLQAGALVGAVSLLSLASDFWADRPFPLIFVNTGASVVQSAIAATVLFYTRNIDFFDAVAAASNKTAEL